MRQMSTQAGPFYVRGALRIDMMRDHVKIAIAEKVAVSQGNASLEIDTTT